MTPREAVKGTTASLSGHRAGPCDRRHPSGCRGGGLSTAKEVLTTLVTGQSGTLLTSHDFFWPLHGLWGACPLRVAHEAPSPSVLRPGPASHGPALDGTLPSAACSLHLGQAVPGRCQPEDVSSLSNSSAHRRETRKAPGLPGGWEQSGDCETTFVSSMGKDHDCLGQMGPKGRGWREMLSLPLPLLSANRMRRNTDVSQEKGVKQECFTFQRNQADKKEGRRKPAKLSTTV